MIEPVRILIIDDNQDTITMVKKILAAEGAELFDATDGEQGICLIQSLKPDLVLLDVMMPGMDGFEVCRRIKNDPESVNVLVIMISAIRTDPSQQVGGLAAGADGYITLPMPMNEMLARIRPFLRIAMSEKALRISEERLRLTLDAINDGFWDWHIPTGQAFFSPVYYSMLGYMPGEFPASYDSWRKLVHPEDISRVDAEIREKIESGQGYLVEFRMLEKDGNWRWVLGRGKVVEKDEAGRPVRMVGTHTDISERKKVEEKLVNSDRIFEHAMDMLCIAGFDGYFKVLNPSWTRILGYSSEELLRRPWIEFVHPEDRDITADARKTLAGGQKVFRFENRYICKNGEIKWLSWNSIPYEHEGLMYGVARDITETKRMEAALKESERKYRSIFENTQDVFYRVDAHGIITEISPSIYRYSGYRREELIGKPVEEVYLNPDDRILLLNILGKTGEVSGYDVQLRTKDGQIRWASLNVHLLMDESGNPSGVEGSMRDITESRMAVEALRESEEKFRSLAEAAPYAIMIYQDDHWVYTNPAAGEISGYRQEELKDNRFWDLVDPEDRKMVETVGKQRQTGALGKLSYEFRFISREGKRKWAYLTGSTILYSGRPAGLVSVIDISERKRNELIQKVLFNISNAVTTTTDVRQLIKGIQHELGLLIDTTHFYIAFYDEGSGMLSSPYNPDEIDHIEVWPARESLTGMVVFQNRPLLVNRAEIMAMNEKGMINLVGSLSQCWLGVPLHTAGKVTGAIVVRSFSDEKAYTHEDVEMLEFVSDQISLSIQRKKTEEELIHALDKARESEQLKSAFLANMSHEIRTPMNAILGFSDLLGKPDTSPGEAERFTYIIRNAGNRLMHIIDDIIDISKLEANLVQIHPAPCNIAGLLKNVTEIHRNSESVKKKHSLELILHLTQETSLADVVTDQTRLLQVLDNLITNAIKYTDHGSITIGVNMVRKEERDFLEFCVKDTGKGIPSEKIAIIFERFRQVEELGYHEGTGLGLSISRALVGLLGGEIDVRSEPGKGSAFFFTIPYITAGPESSLECTHPGHTTPNLAGMHIIVAEDDEDSWILIDFFLEGTGARVSRAVDGDDLMHMLEAEQADLILLDINMPGKTGYECLQEIRHAGNKVRIVAQTAYAMADEKRRCMDSGCDGYLAKPFTKKGFFDCLAAVMRIRDQEPLRGKVK